MNTFAIKFLNDATNGMIVGEEVKQKFTESLKDIMDNNHYPAYSPNRGWFVSNKKPEKLEQIRNDFDGFINKLFNIAK